MSLSPVSRARVAVFAVLAATVSLTACGSSGGSHAISFNSASCGGHWTLAKPGWHTFELYNANDVGGEVDLIDPRTSGIYAEVAQFGPRTTQPMSLDVGSGRYAFRCLFEDTGPATGLTVTVPGHVKGAAATVPVTYTDLVGPAKRYQAYVAAGLKRLAGQTGMLAGDVQRGNLAAARRDWLPAHLTYATLGAAYDSFGKFDDKIDGRADALGVHSPKWTGFCQRIPGSFDATSGSLDAPGGLLNFHAKPHDTPVILNPKTGAVVSGG